MKHEIHENWGFHSIDQYQQIFTGIWQANIFWVGSNFKLMISAQSNLFMDKMLICIYENYGSVCIKFAHEFCAAHDTFDSH